jgi:hypothetical protein
MSITEFFRLDPEIRKAIEELHKIQNTPRSMLSREHALERLRLIREELDSFDKPRRKKR